MTSPRPPDRPARTGQAPGPATTPGAGIRARTRPLPKGLDRTFEIGMVLKGLDGWAGSR